MGELEQLDLFGEKDSSTDTWTSIRQELLQTEWGLTEDLVVEINSIVDKDSFRDAILYCSQQCSNFVLNRILNFNNTTRTEFLKLFTKECKHKLYKGVCIQSRNSNWCEPKGMNYIYETTVTSSSYNYGVASRFAMAYSGKHLIYEVTGDMYLEIESSSTLEECEVLVLNPRFKLLHSSGDYGVEDEGELNINSPAFISRVITRLECWSVWEELSFISSKDIVKQVNLSHVLTLDDLRYLLKMVYVVIDTSRFVELLNLNPFIENFWNSMFIKDKPYDILYRGMTMGIGDYCASVDDFVSKYIYDFYDYVSSTYDKNVADEFAAGITMLPYNVDIILDMEGDGYLEIDSDIRDPSEQEVVIRNPRIKSVIQYDIYESRNSQPRTSRNNE